MGEALLSFHAASTIAAPCAGRTLSGVIAIRAYLGGEDPKGKVRASSNAVLKPLRAAFRTNLIGGAGWGLEPLNCSPGDARRLGCTHDRRCGGNRHGYTRPYFALAPAVFPHPGCSLCWITIRHTFS
jgi:hypothetical protein